MLKIFNDLKPFFRDNYKRINIREYARMRRISPPSASKLLAGLKKDGLLLEEKERNYTFYVANKESKIFTELSRSYWFEQLRKAGLIEHLEKELVNPLVILFGSFSKSEIKRDSDIDLAVFTPSKRALDTKKFETRLGRKIQIFVFKEREDVKNEDLLKNILNGFILTGSW